MSEVSLFRNFAQLTGHCSITSVLSDIQSGTYHASIEAIRKLMAENKTGEAEKLKKQLPGFTPSGKFENGRKADRLTTYSGFVILDLDKLNPEQLITTKATAVNELFTFAAFISPSGNGLKIIVPVTSAAEHHKIAFQQVAEYYQQVLQVAVDPSGKDVSRLCFLSYDHGCFLNLNAEQFKVNIEPELIIANESGKEKDKVQQKTPQNNETADWSAIFSQCVDFTQRKISYHNGSRNSFVHLLACNCNRIGMPEGIAENLILQTYNLAAPEARSTIHSAFANNSAEFAKFANSAKLQNPEINGLPVEDYLKATPTIPDDVFKKLPHLLQEGVRAFGNDKRKRDVFFTGALTILSGCLPNVQGVYGGERVYPHLFSFIIAPAASGKGVMKNAKRLADKLHERLTTASNLAKELFENEMIEYRAALAKRKKDDLIPDRPKEPKFRLVFIPADCSQAMLMLILQDNDGKGIICETEADTMSGANKQDWGNYSPILRGAFHHEKISAARKTNRELIEVKEPQLAVSLSGTPAQVPKLIGSSEDGLFSRFLFYAFKNDIVWQDPSPKPGGLVLNDHFEVLSNQVLQMSDFLSQSPTNILLRQNQWDTLNSSFTERLNEVTIFTSEDAASVVFRLGLILFRLCMVFTALRKFENGENTNEMYCTDDDFNAAITISGTYLDHSLLMFNNLSNHTETTSYKMPNNKKLLLQNLPIEFQRKDAVALGKTYGLSERSVDDFLNISIPSLLEKIKTGTYRKIINYEKDNH
jgi:hypothetical protein